MVLTTRGELRMSGLGTPPDTHREETHECFHDQPVADPYRWLELGASSEARAWIQLQNLRAGAYFAATPAPEKLRSRLVELLSVGHLSVPIVRDGRLFFVRSDGTNGHQVLYFRDGDHGPDHVLLDATRVSSDSLATLDWWYPSPDGRRLAYGVSAQGNERSVLHLIDVESRRAYSEAIPETYFCSLAWQPDGQGFYYTRYPHLGSEGGAVPQLPRRVYLHRCDSEADEDEEIFGDRLGPEMSVECQLSPNGRWLLLTVWRGWQATDLFLQDVKGTPGRWIPVVEKMNARFLAVAAADALYVRTNDGVPRYRLYRVDPTRPARSAWEELISEGEDVLAGHALVGGRLACHYLSKAASQLRLYDLDGRLDAVLEVPAHGTVLGVQGDPQGDHLYYGFTSFTTPSTVARYQIRTRQVDLWGWVEVPFDTDAYEASQITYFSCDGQPVTMFLFYRKGLVRDGRRPTVVHGYGGFGVPVTPMFARPVFLLLDHGGVYAMPNLRGGGEYGEGWHAAGARERKQTTFDDCIGAAEHLIREGYTCPQKLAIHGRSNGGLLVAAVITQRPDLFRAAVCEAPLTDMVRFHRFRLGRRWITEYGDPDDPTAFPSLYAYSPYHRVRAGVSYPAVLLLAAEDDLRVDSLHARKLAAALQWAQRADDRPILLRMVAHGGHARTAGRHVVDQEAEIWTFLFRELGVVP